MQKKIDALRKRLDNILIEMMDLQELSEKILVESSLWEEADSVAFALANIAVRRVNEAVVEAKLLAQLL